MTDKGKQELEAKRKQATLKNMRFNRYLLFRYSLSLLFFANLYWFLIQFIHLSIYILVPVLLIAFVIMALAEQFKLYSSEEIRLNKTQFFFRIQMCAQFILLLIILFTNQYTTIFPIFANTALSRYFMAVILACGILLNLGNLYRIRQIYGNCDRAFIRYKQLENTI